MKREIKFRAWGNKSKCYENEIGKGNGADSVITYLGIGETEIIDNTVIIEQYTGFKDSTTWENRPKYCNFNHPSEWKGIDIYEGDIITVFGDIAEVKYLNGMFVFQKQANFSIQHLGSLSSPAYKVIGNIHENKELLNAKN